VATYYDIFGQKVQYLSSDPANLTEGQVWYNSTSNTAKVEGFQTAAWATGGVYPTNSSTMSGAGTQTAAIAFGGRVYPGPNGPTNISATYDGSSWTATPPINTSRRDAGSAKNGSQTAALMIAGYTSTETNVCEEYDGSTWTSVNNYPVSAREHDQGTGIQTSALCSAGYTGSYITTTCTYDGTTWTALGAPSNMNAGRFSGTTSGTAAAAVMFAGTGAAGNIETWDGSTWTEEAATFNTPRNAGGSAGTSTDAVFFGGETPGPTASNATETWDGTSLATTANMTTGRYSMACSGTASAALSTGGSGGGTNATEEFTGAGPVTKTITTS